ncbi:hypothetical protein BGX38DRAFT_1261582 [Terfezia claveryi]|nr:hypothetical protein BGX38DRAFT_1264113 [Terfezia claveryi]KAF8440715.1 hypothetical protein BGX38DRAFT_1261582 [Terfezia claveryi]
MSIRDQDRRAPEQVIVSSLRVHWESYHLRVQIEASDTPEDLLIEFVARDLAVCDINAGREIPELNYVIRKLLDRRGPKEQASELDTLHVRFVSSSHRCAQSNPLPSLQNEADGYLAHVNVYSGLMDTPKMRVLAGERTTCLSFPLKNRIVARIMRELELQIRADKDFRQQMNNSREIMKGMLQNKHLRFAEKNPC